MKLVQYMSLLCILACPQLLIAAEPGEHRYTPKEQIVFAPSTMVAFDHTGKHASSRALSDGSTITEFNGSMRSITVARMSPDGKVETYCTGSAEAARAWMAGEFDSEPAVATIKPVMEK